MKAQLAASRVQSQPLLIPATFAATLQEAAAAEEHAATLALLGMETDALFRSCHSTTRY